MVGFPTPFCYCKIDRLLRVRSPLLTESHLMSFPRGTEMFHFSRFALHSKLCNNPGGELPAMVLMDSVIRRLPQIMGDDLSAEQDSFVDGLLDYPHYTKPLDFHGQTVPSVLLSGHHANINKWRFLEQVKRTKARRPELWQNFIPNKQQAKWLKDLED